MNEAVLYIIFKHLEETNQLKRTIKIQNYLEAAQTALRNKDVPITFDTYNYKGYLYITKKDKIIRKKEKQNKQIIAELFGYNYNKKNLHLFLSVGYIENNKQYNLNEEEITNILDDGSKRILIYKKIKKEYILNKIEEK